MKSKTLILEINANENGLYVSLRNPKAVTWTYQRVTFKNGQTTFEEIGNKCHDMIEALNRYAKAQGKKEASLAEMKYLGEHLCALLLPANIRQRLIDSDTEGSHVYLILSLDDHLVHIPWELLRINNKYLCEIFRIGRVVKTPQKVIDRNDPGTKEKYRMLVISNPTNDLECAQKEGDDIIKEVDNFNDYEKNLIIECDAKNRITPDKLQEQLSQYDILHYSGHAYFDASRPVNSGWRLTKGNLTAGEIKDTQIKTPSLVFSNACQSARTDQWNHKNIRQSAYGLANAFMVCGTRHYIGSLWDVTDKPSLEFGVKFYYALFNGESVGEAMFQARSELMEESQDVSWAGFVLYGDPRVCYIQNNESVSKLSAQKSIPTIRRTRSETKVNRFGFNVKQLLLYIFICISITVSGIYVNNYLKHEGIHRELLQRIDQRQKNIDRLYEQIIERYGPISKPQCLNASVIIESKLRKFNKKRIYQAAIEGVILENTHFKPLIETETALEIILKNLLVQGPPFHYQFPKVMVLFEYFEGYDWTNDLLLIRLIDVEKGKKTILATIDKLIRSDVRPLQQKTIIFKEVIDLLNAFKIKAEIQSIESKTITMNAGDCQGVKRDDQFQVVDKNIVLSVFSISDDTSKLVVESGDFPVVGDIVEVR